MGDKNTYDVEYEANGSENKVTIDADNPEDLMKRLKGVVPDTNKMVITKVVNKNESSNRKTLLD